MAAMEAAAATNFRSRALTGGSAAAWNWNFIGPLPIFGEQSGFGGVFTGGAMASIQGRVTAVAADPTTPGRWFVGTAGGGVWMTNDGGNTFEPIFDEEPSMAIGAIAIDPRTSPVTIFVGTGEGNLGADSYYGQGIFKSENLGVTWSQLAPGIFDRVAFTRLAIDSNNPPHMFAAVTGGFSFNRVNADFLETDPSNDGLWRSTDDGLTWEQYSFGTFSCVRNGNPCPADDVVIDPSNPDIVYAAIDRDTVHRSTDGGNTWEAVTFPGISPDQVGRQSLALSPSSPETVYAMVGALSGSNYLGFFRSSDSGASWTAATVPTVTFVTSETTKVDGTDPDNFSQSSYDQALTVLPDNPDHLYFGGVGPYLSTDGGLTWKFLGGAVGSTAQSTHADQHAAIVDPFNSDFLYVGNDGGFFSFDVDKEIWTALNFGFSAGQIQVVGPHPSDNRRLIAGFQDNGTMIYTGAQGWRMAANRPRRAASISGRRTVDDDATDPEHLLQQALRWARRFFIPTRGASRKSPGVRRSSPSSTRQTFA